MALTLDTNTNLNTTDKLIKNVAKSLVSSFKLEGIYISMEKAIEIVKNEYSNLGK